MDDKLPILIDRATFALTSAKTSAELLEVRDRANIAYNAAKSAARMAKKKQAYDSVIGAVYKAQADALLIEARAKMRLADEYDEAQEKGEVASGSVRTDIVGNDNDVRPATAADLGLRRDEIHDARKVRDAEAKDPGKTERALKDMVERGEEPTKAKLRRALTDEKPQSKLRKEYDALTDEARAEDWISLREQIEEGKKRIAEQRSMIADLKAKLKELADASDPARKLAVKQRELDAAKYKRDEAMATAKREEYKRKLAEKERDALQKKLEAQEIVL